MNKIMKEKNQIVPNEMLSKDSLASSKQNPDIRRNLQLNPVYIYTKFWTVSLRITSYP